MKGNPNDEHFGDCDHSEVMHEIMRIADDVVAAAMMTLVPLVERGVVPRSGAGMTVSRCVFSGGFETGLRAALMDPIGAQQIIDHLDGAAMISKQELDEANQIIATDARKLLEAIARES